VFGLVIEQAKRVFLNKIIKSILFGTPFLFFLKKVALKMKKKKKKIYVFVQQSTVKGV
jgi:hypothetical protein